jgi:pyruvyl transferase EpsI
MLSKIKRILPHSLKKPARKGMSYVRYKPLYRKKTKEKFQGKNQPRLILLGSPDSSNLGDHAIAEAEKKFFKEQFPDIDYIEVSLRHLKYEKENIKDLINDQDIILIHGGGFLGNLWIEAEEMVRSIIKEFPKNKIIVMPQTIFFDERFNKEEELKKSKNIYKKHNNITFFLREKQSYNFMKENFDSKIDIRLVPDIVTYLEVKNKIARNKDLLMCFRSDKEKIDHSNTVDKIRDIINEKKISVDYTDTVLENEVTEETREYYLDKKFTQFQSYKLVITDRLHGMIFSLITGTPCIALNNASGKVLGVYEWIKNTPYIYCVDNPSQEELETLVDSLLSIDYVDYDNELVIKNFEPLINEIKKNINI